MKNGSELVWLSSEVRGWLRKMKGETGVSVSGFIRDCVLRRLKDEHGVDVGLKRFLLLTELAGLFEEQQMLRQTQNMILANFVYLRDYAEELMKGGYSNPTFVKLRKSILSYPGSERAVKALEHVFGRREQIGLRMCELIVQLYPDSRYEQLGVFAREKREMQMKPLRRFEGELQRDLQEELHRLRSRRRDKNNFEGGENRDGSNT